MMAPPMAILVLLCIPAVIGANTCPDVASTAGTEFMFGVIGVGSTSAFYLYITVEEETQAKVRITAPFNNYDTTITVSNNTVHSLSTSLMQTEAGAQFKGIEVNADKNITLAVIMYGSSYYTEGFTVYPTRTLSTRYVASTYHPYSSYYNEILVAGIESNTDITFNYSTNEGRSFTTQTAQLQKFETYQLKVNYHDISGAVVTSNKPVAVFSGSDYTQIPVGMGNNNYLVEQMIPTKYWTNKYIVPALYPRNYYIVRLYSDEDDTEVHYYNRTHHIAVYIDKGSVHEILFGSDPSVFISNKPIYLAQYPVSNEHIYGLAFMTMVQGISQFASSYKFYTEHFDGDYSTLAVTVKKANVSGILVNRQSITSLTVQTVSAARPMDDYVTIYLNVSYNTFYYVQHVNGMKFGAVLYGLLDYTYGYGYPLKLLLSSSECSSITSPTNAPVHFGSTPSSGQGHHAYEVGNGTWCFNCENMSHLQYCDKVTRCHTDNQICFIQSYTRSENIRLFRSGCMNKTMCQTYGDQVDCQECCSGDFCNTAGCGDEGLPIPQLRGPMCFDCEHHGGNEICQTVQMCRTNQVCKIEQYAWGNSFHKVMGCADYQTCRSKREVQEVNVRHAPVCSACCYSDFCNMNCNAHFAEQIVG